MKINDIFASCEGEGINIGIPEIFIRFQGCSVGCKNCDTPEAKNPDNGRSMSIKEIMKRVEKLKLKRVVLTGGNPTEQISSALIELIDELQRKKYYVTLEATGCDTITPVIEGIFNKVDFLSFDIKTPSTNIVEHFQGGNGAWGYKAQYKMIVSDDNDYKFAKKMIGRYSNGKYNFVITPCWNINKDVDKKFVQKIWQQVIKDKLKCRVVLQMHKVVFGANKRGV